MENNKGFLAGIIGVYVLYRVLKKKVKWGKCLSNYDFYLFMN